MILHNCINCDYFEFVGVPDKCPQMQKYQCPQCKTLQWIYLSRIDPKTYSWDSVEVDEEKKTVKILESSE